MNEKEAIEKATADAFIELYNSEMGTSFSIVENSDSPDIRCKDKVGNKFNFEITLTEDRPKDIKAAIDRSDHRSVESLKKLLEEVKAGRANPLERVKGDGHKYISIRGIWDSKTKGEAISYLFMGVPTPHIPGVHRDLLYCSQQSRKPDSAVED